MIPKWIFNYCNSNFSLEMTSKVENVWGKPTFTHKLTTDRNSQTPSLFFILTVTEWNAQDGGISKAAKNIFMLPSKSVQMKASQETGTEFGQVFLPWNASSEGSIFQFSDAAIFACFVPERISVLSESVEWLILFVPKWICVYKGTG